MGFLKKSIFLFLILIAIPLQSGTRLSKAAMSGDLERVKSFDLTEHPVNEDDHWGWTALMWAVYYRHIQVVEYLLANGADPNIPSKKTYSQLPKGITPISIAAFYGLDDHVALLLTKKANPLQKDSSGKSAIDYAKYYQFDSVIKILESHNSAPNPALNPDAASTNKLPSGHSDSSSPTSAPPSAAPVSVDR